MKASVNTIMPMYTNNQKIITSKQVVDRIAPDCPALANRHIHFEISSFQEYPTTKTYSKI